MKKIYSISFGEELGQASSQWIFPFALKAKWGTEEKLIDVQFSRSAVARRGLVKNPKRIDPAEKKELAKYALYKIKKLMDSREIETMDKLLIKYEDLQEDISKLPANWRVEDFLSGNTLPYSC